MNSIRVSLVASLIAAFTLVTFIAALNGYLSSMREAGKLLDMQLAHASSLLANTASEQSLADVDEGTEDDFAFQVWRDDLLFVRSSVAPLVAINEFVEGYRYANFSGYRWRTLTRQGIDGSWHIVAERADLRHMLAERLVLESILPLLIWLPVSAVLIWVLVGWGLRPLRELSGQINLKRSDDLDPLVFTDPPAELRPLVESTNSLLARLSSAFERERHFAAHAAHELRTPLSVLKVHLHNLASELPEGNSSLAHANAGVERMHHLVEQILDLNRTNPEIIQGNFSPLDLHSLAQRVTAAAWPAFSSRQQNISLEGSRAFINGDAAMLEILLRNLLDNANKYTPQGGDIAVTVNSQDGFVVLRVEDSGPGIPTQEREKVFQRFYRTAEQQSAKENGSGLGLAIVRHIVQLHQAEITLASSRPGCGLAIAINFQQVSLPDGQDTV
jgi:two-component system sensor histidine kinase QseC